MQYEKKSPTHNTVKSRHKTPLHAKPAIISIAIRILLHRNKIFTASYIFKY